MPIVVLTTAERVVGLRVMSAALITPDVVGWVKACVHTTTHEVVEVEAHVMEVEVEVEVEVERPC